MSTGKKRGRALKIGIVSAITALGVAFAGASSASASTVTLDHGFLKINLPDAFEIIDGDTGPVTLANFPNSTGPYNVATGDITFPQFSGTLFGQPLTVDVDPQAALTGNYDAAAGTITGNPSAWMATIDFAGQPCVIGPFNLTFSTATNTIFVGDVFDASSNPPINGAVSADWPTGLPAGVGAGCGHQQGADNQDAADENGRTLGHGRSPRRG